MEWVFHTSFRIFGIQYAKLHYLTSELSWHTRIIPCINFFLFEKYKYTFSLSYSSISYPSAKTVIIPSKYNLITFHFLHPCHHISSKLSSFGLAQRPPNWSPCFCPWLLNLRQYDLIKLCAICLLKWFPISEKKPKASL